MKKIALLMATLVGTMGVAYGATEGVNYTVLPKTMPQSQPGKVEVAQFFWYKCPHCNDLDPVMLKHSKTFASDTYLRPIHVVWDPSFMTFARIAAAVNDSGLYNQATPAIFNAFFRQQLDLSNEATFKDWANKQTGFDGKKLLAAYNAPKSLTEAKQMQELTTKYNITATPTVIIGGKYQVNWSGNFNKDMQVIDDLVAKVRQERGMKAAAPRVLPKSIGASLAQAANR
ncbi:thiol:disulfide interchange protein DsbA/DsbL [Snodgrassella sp. CFCC 13594]|uniref:thiol:disulfide interchange protein DsbA/DsbL n=1 Tax=Snodgrassella sp. CFCC 13594 TaxID=1775559 RepID=UPI0008303033|nr:thiol:disulfide interchange protein DsbA/DsbL [Snodgrassella sp. CFCC 13594]